MAEPDSIYAFYSVPEPSDAERAKLVEDLRSARKENDYLREKLLAVEAKLAEYETLGDKWLARADEPNNGSRSALTQRGNKRGTGATYKAVVRDLRAVLKD